jgi:ssDNA-binding Zn-finger/Zn-ribbon topoisomerase 1
MGKTKIPDSEYVKAICPKCEKIHKAHIFWTGTGKARIYCPQCKASLNTVAQLKSAKVIL